MIDRRTALIGLMAGGAAALGGVRRAVAQASYRVGDMAVRVLSDGYFMVPPDRLAAKPTDEAAFKAAVPSTEHKFQVNVTLIEVGGKRILVDAGGGGMWTATGGKLSDTMAAAGIDPGSIDHVVITHAHPDHLWGVIDDFDNSLRFPNATYFMGKSEHEFWTVAGKAEAAGAAEGSTAGARRVLKAIDDKLKTVGEGEFLLGMAFLQAPGHTPGQNVVIARSGSDTLIVSADTLFHPIVSVQYPNWAPAQDMDGAAAANSRRRVLDLASTTKALVVAYHIEGQGRITRTGTGYVWEKA